MSSKRIKVLFLPAWYPCKLNKLAGIFVKQHALALNKSVQLAVFHVCAHPSLNRFAKFEKVQEDGVLTYRIYFHQFQFKLLRPLNIFSYFLAGFIGYTKTLKDFGRPDINHVHVLTRTGLFALTDRVLHKTPYFISEHWSRYLPERDTYKGLLRKWITKLIVRKSSGISTVSEDLKEAMQQHGIDHHSFFVVPNTVDFDLFKPRADDTRAERFTFLHVSGLTDNVKNVSGILKASRILKSKGAEFRLNIVGDCTKKPGLLELSKQLSLDANVFFLGELTGLELAKQYQQANAFVLFSYFENQPCVLLEAFSSGIPVIASDAGGIPEIVNPRNGILTEAADARQLAENMLKLMSEPELFDGGRIRTEAEAIYSYPAVAGRLLELYDAIKADSKRTGLNN